MPNEASDKMDEAFKIHKHPGSMPSRIDRLLLNFGFRLKPSANLPEYKKDYYRRMDIVDDRIKSWKSERSNTFQDHIELRSIKADMAHFSLELTANRAEQNLLDIKMTSFEVRLNEYIAECEAYKRVRRQYVEISKMYRDIHNDMPGISDSYSWGRAYIRYTWDLEGRRGCKRCRDADRKSNFTALKELMKRAPDLINAIVNTHIFHTNLGNWAEWL